MKTVLILAVALSLAACAGPNARLKNTAVGATGGAVAGAAVTRTPAGAAVGAVGGGLLGWLWPTTRR